MTKQYKKQSKWEKTEQDNKKSSPRDSYTPSYAKTPARYSPKRTVRSFRDLEVYQRTMECSIYVSEDLIPILKKDKFPLYEGMQQCALQIPLLIAQAHGLRFSDFAKSVATLEHAMLGCNKMIVYLEQADGLSHNADGSLIEDLSRRYMQTRGKMLRLQRSWQKFQSAK